MLHVRAVSSLLLLLPFLAALFTEGNAAVGFDTQQTLSTSTLTCLKNNGYTFFIARVYHSYGAIDAVGIQNVQNAHAAGMPTVDGYLFPCLDVKCDSGASQAKATIDGLRAAGTTIGTLWLDIEAYHWPNDTTHNRQFILDMVNTAEAMGVKVGVYSAWYYWRDIVGLDFTDLSRLPLWWVYYNKEQTFDDFTHFGGWTVPTIHQYTGGTTIACGLFTDLDWHP
uniref:Lysozyme n=1 Tax=Plectus sambesii TaxID=2011161 RepID=A0A914WE23_9BILA